MQYQEFDSMHNRRGAALSLTDKVYEQIAKGRHPLDGWIPDSKDISALRDQWLPADRFVCQYQEHEEPCNWEPLTCGRRCSATYWRKHCGEVAFMMEALARELGEPVELWRTTGFLHDLDYVRYPHHDRAISSDKSHPLGISTQLFQKGAPPVLILAILSHAPHLQLRPESALGWALLACDEHATMSGFGLEPHYHTSIDPRLTACMLPPRGVLHGFHRNDMEGRGNLAMLELTRVLGDKSLAWQPSPADPAPIDWDSEVQGAFPERSSSAPV